MDRTIAVPQWAYEAVDNWTLGAGINSGPLLRSINKAGRIWGHGFTPKVIWAIVKLNAKVAALHLWHCTTCDGPVHDCAIRQAANWRRFSFLLGHVSIQTTERYLGCKQRFRDAVNDHIGLEPDAPS